MRRQQLAALQLQALQQHYSGMAGYTCTTWLGTSAPHGWVQVHHIKLQPRQANLTAALHHSQLKLRATFCQKVVVVMCPSSGGNVPLQLAPTLRCESLSSLPSLPVARDAESRLLEARVYVPDANKLWQRNL
jgi:hypothetical protein